MFDILFYLPYSISLNFTFRHFWQVILFFYKSYFSRHFPASLYTCSSVLADITIIFMIPSTWIVLYTTLIPRFRNFIF